MIEFLKYSNYMTILTILPFILFFIVILVLIWAFIESAVKSGTRKAILEAYNEIIEVNKINNQYPQD